MSKFWPKPDGRSKAAATEGDGPGKMSFTERLAISLESTYADQGGIVVSKALMNKAAKRCNRQGQLNLTFKDREESFNVVPPTINDVRRFCISRIPQLVSDKLARSLPRATHHNGMEYQIRKQIYHFLECRENRCWVKRQGEAASSSTPWVALEKIAQLDAQWLLGRLALEDGVDTREVFSSYSNFIARLRERTTAATSA